MEATLFIIAAIVAVVVGILVKIRQDKRRSDEMQRLSLELGFQFDPNKNQSLAQGFSFLKYLNKGDNRYAHNILSGHSPRGEPALIFDYHFEEGSGNSTEEFNFTIFILKLPRTFPELQIEPKGLGALLKEALGFDDIDFESVEFSKRYDVRSRDKKFAYDFCNGLMIDYLLRSRDFVIEVDRCNLALTFKERLPSPLCRANYHRLLEIRDLMPNYLFS